MNDFRPRRRHVYAQPGRLRLPSSNYRPARRTAFQGARHQAWQVLTKVPKITAYFWIIKILTTGMGEALSDFLVHRYNPYLAVLLGTAGIVAALVWQFSREGYSVWAYWTAVAMVSVFGTMAADVLHVKLGIPYIVSSLFYAVVLTIIFAVWYASERTLSIHSIHTKRREAFYWLTVLATFALGTATGDLTAATFHLGYFFSGVLFAVIFAIPALAYWLFRINAVFAFWFAYIITRPLGASFADWFGVPHYLGGLNFGRGNISLVLTALIVVFVTFLAITHRDEQAKI
ncbi:MAG TPA: hypothetical protein VGS28_02440 [Candidatus Saccharimonadales bacterium]|nr:hypothetical protein [Candidatus Saccharimonadales bacterium]